MSNRTRKSLIVIGLFATIAVVIFAKHLRYNGDYEIEEQSQKPGAAKVADKSGSKATFEGIPSSEGQKALPRLVDLGADRCIPCKMMAPILKQLKVEYAGLFKVEFIDVWKKPEAGKEYGIRVIPTQIFYDSSGRELFRHEGFFSKKDILAKWKEFDIDLNKKE